MDAGMTSTGHKTVEDAIEKGAAPIDLAVPQVIDVMDHLLSCEVMCLLLSKLEVCWLVRWKVGT